MATVRTTAPRGADPGGKRKRKRLEKAEDASAAVSAQLQTLENWHRAISVDMRELRREGARVRVELEKVDDTAEAAVQKAARCAAQAQAATQAKDAAQQKLQESETRHGAEVEKMLKKVAALDRKVESVRQSSINEELLMTQLTGLQEQYENELSRVKDEHDAALRTQQKQLDGMHKRLAKMHEDNRHKKHMESVDKMLQSLREENKRLQHKLTQMVTRQEMETLQNHLQTLERDSLDEQGRTRADLNTFEDKLAEVESRFGDVDRKVADVDRKADQVGARAAITPPPLPPPLPPVVVPPPALPRDLVRQGDLAGIHEQLHRVNRDLRVVDVDFTALAKRMDEQGGQQEQYVELRLRELSKQLFDALGHDSSRHVNEISRLKDAVFDLQSDHREFGQKMRQLEADVQQATSVSRARSRSPPRDRGDAAWRYGRDQPPILPTPPLPPPLSQRSHRERPSRYEPAPEHHTNTGSTFEPPAQEPIRWAPQGRSRSRSPPRLSTRGAARSRSSSRTDSGLALTQNNQHNNPDRSNLGNADSGRNIVTELTNSSNYLPSQALRSSRGENGEVDGQSTLPFRRSRQLRRTPEVIVIEEDDDDSDDDNEPEVSAQRGGGGGAEEGDNEEEAESTAPSRSSPDVVLDEEEASQTADVIMTAPPDSSSTDHVESTDHLEKEADLQTGFLLYFCLGGAPDLGVHWTNCFSQLRADECLEMPRVLRFQRRHGVLQNFPVYLTQCILQAVILNGQNVPEGNDSEPSRTIGALSVSNVQTKFDDVVKDIHLSWVRALIDYLSKLASSIPDLASKKVELSINPAGLSSSADKDDIIYEWSRRQESVMWILARKLHYGSSLPLMKCNGDASPAVYLFTLMFDVEMAVSACPESGSFRLNTFGAKLIALLWDHTLKKLPYVFFADWSWLEEQSTKQKLPALGFCHLLASILLWNSAIDRHSLTNRSVYADAVKYMLPKLFVGGKVVHGYEDDEASFLLLGECETTRIELLDLDIRFASILGLDGFFDVMEAIQNNMLAVAEVDRTRSS